jgi:hypothetical protein
MRKRLAVIGALTAVVLGAASAASAYVMFPTDTSNVHSLVTCVHGGVIGGNLDGRGAITSSTDLGLTIHWGASTPSQINTYLGAEFGSIVISNYDESTGTIGSPIAGGSKSWGNPLVKQQTDVSLWTAPFAVNDPTLNGGHPFSATKFFWDVGPLPSGTYWVGPDFRLSQTISDGGTQFKKDTAWDNIGCEMVVN